MAAQHDMSADIKLAEQNASSIGLGIDGAPHDLQKLTAMLRKRGLTKNVVGCKLVHELAQPNSITGALDLDDAAIARRDSDSLTLTGIPACGPTASLSSKSSMVDIECKCRSLVGPSAAFLNSINSKCIYIYPPLPQTSDARRQ